ncbi:MAG: phosphoglycerate kinase [Verrucomicrobiota bacterium]
MTQIPSVSDLECAGKRVFVRVDFNVPLTEDGKVSDDTRIRGALPTIELLLSKGARVILASHLGRPKGEPNPKYSLRPVAADLSDKLKRPVMFVEDAMGPETEAIIESTEPGSVVLLENMRFYPGETKNDPELSKRLAALADIYVNDAFGTAHRAHASTAGIAEFVKEKACGLLIERELAYLGDKVSNPERPFTVILGGAKVSDKIMVIDTLLEKADTIIIGGAMAYTFKLAIGETVGDSLCEPDKIETAQEAMKKAQEKGVKFLLPSDTMIVKGLDFGAGTFAESQIIEGDIPEGWEGVDIGPKSAEVFSEAVKSAKTVLWNGPMGIFEIPACAQGTFAVAEAIAQSDNISIIGGGDSVTAINKSGFAEQVTFMSTGGGASLEFLEGKELPGVAALAK